MGLKLGGALNFEREVAFSGPNPAGVFQKSAEMVSGGALRVSARILGRPSGAVLPRRGEAELPLPPPQARIHGAGEGTSGKCSVHQMVRHLRYRKGHF